MRKTKMLIGLSLAMVISFSFNTFAGEWEKDKTGWWWRNDDGSYPVNGWEWIDGNHDGIFEAYYFDHNGYLLTDTVTPDGRIVDRDGMWREDGIIMFPENQKNGELPGVKSQKVGANHGTEASAIDEVGNVNEIPTVINVEGLSSQQDGYVVTYQYFNVFQEYDNTKYQAIIEIQNTGEGNLYLGTSTFDIYNSSGNIIASETFISSDPDVIAPGEKGYFYSNGGYLDNVPMGDYVLRPRITVEKTNLPATRYTVGQSSLKVSEFGKNPTIVGTITNNTGKDEAVLWIVAVFYDKNDLPIGVCGTNILNFNAGITTGFELEGWHLPEYVTKDKISRYDIIAAPTQYQF